MLNHLVQVQVGLAGSRRYNFHNIKMTGEVASADTVVVIHNIGEVVNPLNHNKYIVLNVNIVFDLRNIYQECNPGVKQDLLVNVKLQQNLCQGN
jgi:hypothetical protein